MENMTQWAAQTWEQKITADQLKRVTSDWSKDAGEPVKVEAKGNDFYAFGSELACLRLFHKWNKGTKSNTRVDYSKTLKTYFFVKYER